LARYPRPQFIVYDNGGEFKREFKKMCDNYGIKVKPTTSHNPQANTIIERVHKDLVVNDMLRSYDLKNNHQNLEEQEDNPFDYFLQSTAWLLCYYKHLSYNTAGNTKSTCVWQRYDPQYCLQSKLGSNTKTKKGHYK
jgi:transposase InsO family protein